MPPTLNLETPRRESIRCDLASSFHPQARDMQLVGNWRVLIGHHHGWSEFEIASGTLVAGFTGYEGVLVLDGLDNVESAKSARQYFEVMRHMHPLPRATRAMPEVLQNTREALPDDTRIITLRDLANDLERAIELVAADAKAGMDFTLAESASQQAVSAAAANHEARRLNRLAAFFFPLATLVAVFGMDSPEEMIRRRASGSCWRSPISAGWSSTVRPRKSTHSAIRWDT